jgi:beta-phosphoglucomutase family hydrolase
MGRHELTPGVVLPGMEGVLFDLDGVLTPTAAIHRRAWAAVFTAFFRQRGITPPYSDQDYFAHIDGKPRFEGVADMLASRGVALPFGQTDDPPGEDTVCALGNAKNQAFNTIIRRDPVRPYPGANALLDQLAKQGVKVAVVSSSANAKPVLAAAGLLGRFQVVVDGLVAAQERLPGKPAPDTFRYGAKLLGLYPLACAVLEDAIAGVAAARAGGFGKVVGVDRGTGAAGLRKAGADIVISELTDLLHQNPPAAAPPAP